MSDLVERQVAIDKMYNAFSYAYCNNCDKEDDEDRCGDFCHRKYINWAASKNTIEREINSLPSAEPEIIRCKDCELFYKNMSPFGKHECDSGNENGYCFWVVRKEE